jgi:hypothetical protein
MKTLFLRCLQVTFWMCLTLGFAHPAHAAFTSTISRLIITNPDDVIVAADGTDGDPESNRHGVSAQATLRFTGTGLVPQSALFRTHFQLLDEAGTVVDLDDGAGGVTSTVTVEQPGGVPGGIGTIRTDQFIRAVLIPSTPLNPAGAYRVYASLEREVPPGSGVFTEASTPRTTAPQYFFYFAAGEPTDAEFHVLGDVDQVVMNSTVIIRSQPGQEEFSAQVDGRLLRFDELGAAPTSDDVTVTLRMRLLDDSDPLAPVDVVLAADTTSFVVSVPTYRQDEMIQNPSVTPISQRVSFAPADWLTFDPLRPYRLEVTMETLESDGVTVIPQGFPRSPATMPSRLLGLSGKLFAGAPETVFTGIANDPTSAAIVPAPANDPAGGDWFTSQLAIAIGTGTYSAAPGRTYGDGVPFPVMIFRNGDALMVDTAKQALSTPEVDIETVAGLRVIRTILQLTPNGVVADALGLVLPPGFGVTTSPTARRLLPVLEVRDVLLDDSLLPAASPVRFEAPGGVSWYACHDTLPLRLRTPYIQWNRGEGTLTFSVESQEWVRLNEHLRHEVGVLTTLQQRFGNDGFYRFVARVGDVSIAADADGKALLTTQMDIDPGFFISHFPLGQPVDWSGGGRGQLTLVNSVVTEPSFIDTLNPTTLRYHRGCPGPDCPGSKVEAGNFEFAADDATMRFTPDRGLQAAGNVVAQTMEWGTIDDSPRFAHRTTEWTRAGFHVPGHALVSSSLPTVDQAAALLLTGYGSPEVADRLERPLTPEYSEGFSDYAGLNFRTTDQQAQSILANRETPPYALKLRSKYYVRPAGVNGIHDAVSLLPPVLTMYGFDVTLDGLRLAYLDNENTDSRTGGSVRVPDPVTPALGFDLQFKNLFFKCQGQPGVCTLDTRGETKTLDYWETDFIPLSMEFKQPVLNGCADVATGFIALGVETKLPAVTASRLFGEFAFKASGNFVTEGDPLSAGLGVDSRLELPTQLTIAGPGSKPWKLTPATKAYFNNPELPAGKARPDRGFLSFAGTMDLPWYQDCKVHVHASSSSRATELSQQFLMGGWHADPTRGPGEGWKDGLGHHFFTHRNFDTNHYAFEGADVNEYRNPATSTFNPLGERVWLNTVDFSFPLQWQGTTRRFDAASIQRDLLVLGGVHRSLTSLTPEIAELTFGAEYQGLPRLNTAKLITGAIEEVTGLFSGLSQAMGEALPIANAIQQLDGLLAEQMARALDPPLDAALETPVQLVYEGLGNAAAIDAQLATVRAELTAVGSDGALVTDITQRLDQAEQGLNILIALLNSADPAGEPGVGSMVKALLAQSDIPALAAIAGAAVDEVLVAELPKMDPQLRSLSQALTSVRDRLRQARTVTLSQVSALFAALGKSGQALDTASRAALDDIKARYGALPDPVRWRAENPPHIVVPQLKRLIKERLLATVLVPKLQSVLKQNLADLNTSFRGALDDLFGEVNTLLRTVVEEKASDYTAGLDATVNGALGDIAGKLGAAKLEGYAQINDESLRLLDINGQFEFNVPDKMKVGAHLRIQEFDSDSPPSGCRNGTTRLTEVIVDANAEISWIGEGIRAEVGSKITLQNDPPSNPKAPLVVRGFDGYFGLTGQIGIGPVVVTEVRLAAGMGSIAVGGGKTKDWAYIAAKARGRMNAYEVAAGLFFGRTCDLKVIADIDAEVGKALSKASPSLEGTLPLTGVYAYGEGWIPLNEVFGIPSTCLFTIRVGGGAGFFAFVNDEGRILVGAKQFFGVEGTLLCIFSIRGELKLVGLVDVPGTPSVANGGLGSDPKNGGLLDRADRPAPAGASLTLFGDGFVQGRFGPCPFCLKISKSLGIMLRVGGDDPGMEIDF